MTKSPPRESALSAGAFRDSRWDRLAATRVVKYPLPPHGYHPNFVRSRNAARHLLAHPEVAGLRVLIVGPERVLLPLRELALEAGVTLYVPYQKKEGWYWRLQGPAGAQAAVLACVAADRRGGRVGKGSGGERTG